MKGTADILVAGAGPAGLALALQAHDHGAAVRVVDRRPEADRPSRALIMHARTLEVLRPLGVTQALLARADIAPTADLQLGSRVIRVALGDLALPDTAFPHLSLIRQMDVERVLAQALADRGIEVERGTELVSVLDGSDGVRSLLRSPAKTEQAASGFVVGCDGPASTVRADQPHTAPTSAGEAGPPPQPQPAAGEEGDDDVLRDGQQPPLDQRQPAGQPLRVLDLQVGRVGRVIGQRERRVPVGAERAANGFQLRLSEPPTASGRGGRPARAAKGLVIPGVAAG